MSEGRVLITGAGVGGLALGCALAQRGIEPVVYERAGALKPVGAGLSMQTNALLALRRLGLAEAVKAAGAVLTGVRFQDWKGNVLAEASLALIVAEFGEPMVVIHRARLHEILLAAMGPERLHLGRVATGFDQDAEGVTLELADGSERGAALVGADGLRSVVRERLRGAETLRYAGYTAWRGVCPLPAGGLPARGVEVWGPGMRFGYTPMGSGEVYWFATANAPAGGADGERPREELLSRFEGWAEPVATLIASTPEAALLRTDILDRKPVDSWSRGRVTLLGDAAHPMTPNLGQGACQAIEDAVVLAECLAESPDPVAAFRRYEARRQARTRWFVERSWAIGAVGQWEQSVWRALRDAGMRLTPSGAVVGQLRAMVAGSGLG
ncbi:MAG: FAD-dependent monooxygenase [Candidatus Sericytochromatia bacterium]